MVLGLSASHTGRLYPQEIHLVLFFFHCFTMHFISLSFIYTNVGTCTSAYVGINKT